MGGKKVEISGYERTNAIHYAKQIEDGVKDSLERAQNLKAKVISSHWHGKTYNAFLSYLELLIQFNQDMANALEDHTKAIATLDENIESFTNTNEVRVIKNL